MKKNKYTVRFQVELDSSNIYKIEMMEFDLKDLIQSAVLPALNLELIPLTFEVKKARS